MRTITNFTAAKVCKKHRKTNYKFCKDQELVMRRSGGLICEMILLWAAHTTNCHTNTILTISYLRTVVHWASWNCRTMVSRAGSMYQILAKMKEMMERLAMLQTTPISTSSNQAVRFDHCLAQNSLQPRLWSRRRGELELTRLLFLFQWTQQFSAGSYSTGLKCCDVMSYLH